MRYIIDTSLFDFVQFISLVDKHDTYVKPHAEMYRDNGDLLHRLNELLSRVIERKNFIVEHFHDSTEAYNAYRFGEVFSSPGVPILTAIMHQRETTILANSTVLFNSVYDLESLQAAVQKAIDTKYEV